MCSPHDMMIDPAHLMHVPEDDANLILQLLEEDTEQIVQAAVGKGKRPENAITDAELAADVFVADLRAVSSYANDLRMAKSLQKAVKDDEQILLDSQLEERMAENDRELSMSMRNGDVDVPQREPEKLLKEEDELIDKLSCLYITGIEEDDAASGSEPESDATLEVADQPESSSWGASRPSGAASRRPRKRKSERRYCEACGNRLHFALLAKTPCGHEYCRDCITQIFGTSMTDEAFFPPRCCTQPIPLEKNRLFLDPDLVPQYQKKALEFSTSNRVYCSNPDCAAFIPPVLYTGKSVVSCEHCMAETCVSCKKAAHKGDCAEDENLQKVLEMARESGWQRCQNCWGMVELSTGCFHMTCRCSYQFCYICGSKWKTCCCEQWDEGRLLDRAAEIDARDHGHGAQGDPARARNRIQNLAQNLRVNHECQHERWANRAGGRTCEECNDWMPIFIYECRQCRILACRRCRYHRL
ncbi:hypothetical protein N3K66_008339 [Trichothecium roseum]|uniref:Uncharacterized protein n=1 Tax=Trichothecium roseum TaxID=47278 RepID=A0ACC0UQE6_9HYPO|nr:hypothetical protein N3K66_008339 [Trichothecium roseum]